MVGSYFGWKQYNLRRNSPDTYRLFRDARLVKYFSVLRQIFSCRADLTRWRPSWRRMLADRTHRCVYQCNCLFVCLSIYLSTGPVLLQQPRVQRGLQGAPGEAGLRGGGGRSGHSVDIPHRCLLNVQSLHYLVGCCLMSAVLSSRPCPCPTWAAPAPEARTTAPTHEPRVSSVACHPELLLCYQLPIPFVIIHIYLNDMPPHATRIPYINHTGVGRSLF